MSELYPIRDADYYQLLAVRTASIDYAEICARLCYNPGEDEYGTTFECGTIDLMHAALGIDTEGGEFADPIKKHLFYGKPLVKENMREELGDILWYIAIAAEALDTTLSVLMTENIRKLAKRYPNKNFTETDAHLRADKNETE